MINSAIDSIKYLSPRKFDFLLCVNARMLKMLTDKTILLTFFRMTPIYFAFMQGEEILLGT